MFSPRNKGEAAICREARYALQAADSLQDETWRAKADAFITALVLLHDCQTSFQEVEERLRATDRMLADLGGVQS